MTRLHAAPLERRLFSRRSRFGIRMGRLVEKLLACRGLCEVDDFGLQVPRISDLCSKEMPRVQHSALGPQTEPALLFRFVYSMTRAGLCLLTIHSDTPTNHALLEPRRITGTILSNEQMTTHACDPCWTVCLHGLYLVSYSRRARASYCQTNHPETCTSNIQEALCIIAPRFTLNSWDFYELPIMRLALFSR